MWKYFYPVDRKSILFNVLRLVISKRPQGKIYILPLAWNLLVLFLGICVGKRIFFWFSSVASEEKVLMLVLILSEAIEKSPRGV